MAELFNVTKGKKNYQVRSAGQSVRLYTNGVFHSQFNFRQAFAGHIWDLLALPILACEKKPRLKVLVLGLGGGAVVRQLRSLCDTCDITAVELDATHIQLAKRFFKVHPKSATLVHADAQVWLVENSQKFDLIVDDLFGDSDEHPTNPTRAVSITSHWLDCLNRHLTPGGVLVFNTESASKVAALAVRASNAKSSFKSLLQLGLPNYQNAIALLGRSNLSARDFTDRLQQAPLALPCKRGKYVYKITDRTHLLTRQTV